MRRWGRLFKGRLAGLDFKLYHYLAPRGLDTGRVSTYFAYPKLEKDCLHEDERERRRS